MPRDPAAEIEPIMASLREQVTEMLRRRGLLQTPTQTLEAELELSALGRQFADEVMEKLLAASVEGDAEPRSPGGGVFPLRQQEDALCGAAQNDGAAPGRTTSAAQDELSVAGADAASGTETGERTTR
jgi:hypothetical protein